MLEVCYYVAGRVLLHDATEHPPRRGDEIGFDGATYQVVRVVWHKPMCPPDRVHVHLQLSTGEEISTVW